MLWNEMFKDNKSIIGMIHVPALPGTPLNKFSINQIIEMVLKEAEIYQASGIDSIMLENMHDVPYLNRQVGPEIISSMTVVTQEVRRICSLPLGIQILAGANQEALAVALAVGLNYIRAEGFVFSHVADEGLMNACAGELLRYRKNIGAEHIAVLTDIKKKHSSHAITSDVDIAETAKAAEFFLSDGLIITGESTGKEAQLSEVKSVKDKCSLPVIIGSGITLDNIEKYYPYADGFIIGSWFKEEGKWNHPLSSKRVQEFMQKIFLIRKNF